MAAGAGGVLGAMGGVRASALRKVDAALRHADPYAPPDT